MASTQTALCLLHNPPAALKEISLLHMVLSKHSYTHSSNVFPDNYGTCYPQLFSFILMVFPDPVVGLQSRNREHLPKFGDILFRMKWVHLLSSLQALLQVSPV